jgi:hypothetical protein
MAITHTRTTNNVSTASAATVAVTITASAAGCLLVVSTFTGSNHTTTGVSDNINGSTGWTQATSAAGSQGASRTEDIWYHLNPGSGVTTVTVTFSVSDTTGKEAIVHEFAAVSTFDTGAHLNDIASAASQTGAAATPSTTTNVLVTNLRTAGSMTGETGPFTVPTNGITSNGNGSVYLINAAASSQAATFSLSAGASCSGIAVFKETVSGTTRGMPFETRSTAFNGGRTFRGPMHAPVCELRQAA